MKEVIIIIPPAIYHCNNKPEYFEQMIYDCAKNIHMRMQATNLLLFYAKQSNGFRAALLRVSNETNIPINKIHEVRQRLIDYGLINYNKKDKYIAIAWDRIRAFASLDCPLHLTRNKCLFLPYTDVPKYFSRRKTIRQLGKQYRIINPRNLTEEEERFYNILEDMTEEEYYLMVEGIRQTEFPQYPIPQTQDEIARLNRFVRESWEHDE